MLALMSDPAADSPLNCDAGASAARITFDLADQLVMFPKIIRIHFIAPVAERLLVCFCLLLGNLLRVNDIRGYSALAFMYTIDLAMGRVIDL